MAKTSKAKLNSSSESGHLCLVPNLKGNPFNFSPLRIMFAVSLSYMAFIMLSYVPSMPAFWRVFIINGCWFWSKAFSVSIEIIKQRYWAVSLASMAAWHSSTGIFHHDLLPHIPSIRLSTVNSSPHPGITPQSPNSSFPLLCLPEDLCPCMGMYGCGKDCLILIPFRLPQIICFTLSLKCFSSDSNNCPYFSSPTHWRQFQSY